LGLGKLVISQNITMEDVMLVETLSYNLLSIAQPADMGFATFFDVGIVVLLWSKSLKAAFVGHVKNGLYVIDFLEKVDTSQTYLSFLMLHVCLCTNCFMFCYTSWHFYAFSETNLLTRCHSASSLFSVFVFQKSYIGNILKIGRNKSRSSYFSRHETESKAETEGGKRAAHHAMAKATPWPRRAMVWALGPPPDIALPPIYSPR
jgi:hypothetical protein